MPKSWYMIILISIALGFFLFWGGYGKHTLGELIPFCGFFIIGIPAALIIGHVTDNQQRNTLTQKKLERLQEEAERDGRYRY